MSKKNLFNDFSAVSTKEWKQKIQVDLKGADYNDTLVWESPEGIKVKPFYNTEDIASFVTNVATPEWKIGQAIFVQNEVASNKKAVDALKRGAEDLVFTIPTDTIKIDVLLKNINLKDIKVYFYFQFLASEYIAKIEELYKDNATNIHYNIDIVGNLASSGNWFHNLTKDHQE